MEIFDPIGSRCTDRHFDHQRYRQQIAGGMAERISRSSRDEQHSRGTRLVAVQPSRLTVGGPAGSLVRTQAVGDQRRVYATQPRLYRCSAPWVSRVGHSQPDGISVWLSHRCWLPGLPGGAPPGHLAVLLASALLVIELLVQIPFLGFSILQLIFGVWPSAWQL